MLRGSRKKNRVCSSRLYFSGGTIAKGKWSSLLSLGALVTKHCKKDGEATSDMHCGCYIWILLCVLQKVN